MLLTLFVFSITFLLPVTLTVPPLTDIIVSCHTYPTRDFHIADCEFLMSELREHKTMYAWANQPLTWGPTQAYPSKTPLHITIQTCRMEIQARYPRGRDTEVFNVADYFDALDEVLRVCFRLKMGRTGGVTPLGRRNLFHAYIGGIQQEKANMTIAGPLNGVLTS